MTDDVILLASELIRRKSISPHDDGCQQLVMSRLGALGFKLEPINYSDTHNLWAWHGHQVMPTLVFAGHTDVVPPGDEKQWFHPPFEPTIDSCGNLYGRGAADMKGSLAAMICATEEYIAERPRHQGRIAFIITSDEEASAEHGTIKVVHKLQQRNEHVDFCIIGEPTSRMKLGDQVKNGRRGSLIAKLTIYGQQGHIAYPELAHNPIHHFSQALAELVTTKWDNGNNDFPKTTMQIVNIHSGLGNENIIPDQLTAQFGFRYGSELNDTILKTRVEQILSKHKLNYQLKWRLSGKPFITPPGILTKIVREAISDITKIETTLSTSGGTSDGRFIAELGCQVIEFGALNSTIHQVNEHIAVNDLLLMKKIYKRILQKLIGSEHY